MKNKETIEEAAERIFPDKMSGYEIFLLGAKYNQGRSYSEEEAKFIERLISFYWVEYNNEHPNNLKEFELSKSILEKLKKK